MRLSRVFLALRPHQWIKNLLIFAPLFAAHRWTDIPLLLTALYSAIAFSCAASAIYLINDILDVESDRRHPTKKFRPIAAGEVGVRFAAWLSLVLATIGLALAWSLSFQFFILLLGYIAASQAYSLKLKTMAPLDVFLLTGFYTLRIHAGGVVTDTPPSIWLLVFSGFFFFSLALAKRLSELLVVEDAGRRRREYIADDIPTIMSLGVGSALLSVLVVSLYATAPDARVVYSNPDVLLFICPILGYWLSRMWLLARRKQVQLDPILFAVKDRQSWICAFLMVLVIFHGSR